MVKSKKMSNIELLRILLFLMVICIHSTSVGLVVENGFTFWNTNYKYAMYMRIFSNCAIMVFVLISGFLLGKKEISLRKYWAKILSPFLLYLPMILFGYYFIIMQHDILQIVDDFFKFGGYFYHLWYIVVLLLFSLFIPYVNKILNAINQKQHFKLSIICIAATSFTFTIKNYFSYDMFSILASDRLALFFCLYIVGAYIGKYGIKLNRYIAILGYLAFVTAIYSYAYKSKLKLVEIPFLNYSDLTCILMAICLFTFFVKLNFSNKFINFIGDKTYGAYIIHVIYLSLLQKHFTLFKYFQINNYFLYDIAYIFIIFTLSILTETARQGVIQLYKSFKQKSNVGVTSGH